MLGIPKQKRSRDVRLQESSPAIEDGIPHHHLQPPEKLNAFTGTMMAEMIDAFRKANTNDAVRCIIVTGSGAPSAPAPIYRRAPRPSTRRSAPTGRSAMPALPTPRTSTGATSACATAAAA